MNIIKGVFQSSIGKKYVVAITGTALLGFVIVHMLGNLQILLGMEKLNAYALLLTHNKVFLWTFRVVLAMLALTHILTALLLAWENRAVRPTGYATGTVPYAPLSARTMVISGALILTFAIYHILHFTVGVTQPSIAHLTDPQGRHDVYRMVLLGFSHPAVAFFYILSMVLLYLHLQHGIASIFQSLGLKNREFSGLILGFAHGVALLLLLGNSFIPIAVLTGLISS